MKEIVYYFFRLGCLGFGGPLALIAQMQKDLVDNRKWIAQDEFNTALPLIKAMPGPVAFQTAVYFGHRRSGFWGGLAAGFCLVFPACVLMVIFAQFTSQNSNSPSINALLRGMEIAALGVILGSLKSLALPYLKKKAFWFFIGISILLASFSDISEPVIIIICGILALVSYKRLRGFYSLAVPLDLALVCLKAGALVFGTGLAIVPMLEQDFVTRLQWINHSEFMTALSFGQITPGPVMVTVTFIGYKIMGLPGATLATVCVFLPSFIHMSTWFPRFVKKLAQVSWIPFFVLGAIGAVCATIFVSVIRLGRGMNLNVYEILAVVIILALNLRSKIPAWATIPTFGILYLIIRQILPA